MRQFFLFFVTSWFCSFSLAADNSAPVFELRTYYTQEGKLDALLERFQKYTCQLFEKHGITNVAYWVPVENTEQRLVYLLSFPSEEERKNSWKKFREDPDWKAVRQKSIVDGKLVSKIESVVLAETDFSKGFPSSEASLGIYEMRVYRTNEGMLPHLHSRFREHSQTLFEKHGMTNLGYFELLGDQEESDQTLIYFLAHKTAEAAKQSWTAFRTDPEWKAVASSSEENAGGPLLLSGSKGSKAEKPITATYLKATDFSPLR